MKINFDTGEVKLEKGEPYWRSCWKCNSAHHNLKKVNMLHTCFECGRSWIFDRFLDEFKTDEGRIKWLKRQGVKSNQSTSKVDKGYRIVVLKFKPKKGLQCQTQKK